MRCHLRVHITLEEATTVLLQARGSLHWWKIYQLTWMVAVLHGNFLSCLKYAIIPDKMKLLMGARNLYKIKTRFCRNYWEKIEQSQRATIVEWTLTQTACFQARTLTTVEHAWLYTCWLSQYSFHYLWVSKITLQTLIQARFDFLDGIQNIEYRLDRSLQCDFGET